MGVCLWQSDEEGKCSVNISCGVYPGEKALAGFLIRACPAMAPLSLIRGWIFERNHGVDLVRRPQRITRFLWISVLYSSGATYVNAQAQHFEISTAFATP